MNCIICGVVLSGQQSKYCSRKCKNTGLAAGKIQKQRGLERKKKLVLTMGGGCSICGYKRNLAALSFHHTKEKSFKLDMRSLSNRSMARIMLEVTKCILVCSNCHAELHHPTLSLRKKEEKK